MPAAKASLSCRPRRHCPTISLRRRRCRIRKRVPRPPAPLPAPTELRLEGIVLDESSLRKSPLVPYVRMVVSLIEGVRFTCREIVGLLRRTLRQHSIGAGRGIDYLRGFQQQRPP